MKVVIGIDPGLDGAIAVIVNDKYTFYDIPTFKIKVGKKFKRQYDIQAMVGILRKYIYDSVNIGLEKVHAMPGQGVTSMFTMGEGLGIWKGIIAGLELPVTHIIPQRWKKSLMDGMSKEKDASRQRAIQLFPQLADQLKLKKHHGRADALLIAEYLRRTL